MQVVSFKQVGPPNTPHEVLQWRRQVMDMFRFLGQPVVHRHRFSPQDEIDGVAQECPACFNSVYGNVRSDCPVCFGVGYTDTEDHPTLWINTQGRLTATNTGLHAPTYGGFGQPYLTWAAEPDVREDVFKVNEQGIFQRIAQATAVAPWYPEMNDNDLLFDVEVSHNGNTVQTIRDRYELKMTQPITIRGWGIRTQSKREHLVQQSFEMTLLPKNHYFYNVPLDTLTL